MRKLLIIISIISLFSSCEKQVAQTNERDKIVGEWDVVEKEGGATQASVQQRSIQDAYIVHLTRSEVFADEVYIYNFFQYREDHYVPAHIENKTITIDKIELDENTYRGQGTISSDYHTITWTYWVDEGYGEEEYTAVYSFRK